MTKLIQNMSIQHLLIQNWSLNGTAKPSHPYVPLSWLLINSSNSLYLATYNGYRVPVKPFVNIYKKDKSLRYFVGPLPVCN
jgi:hypothetical protein